MKKKNDKKFNWKKAAVISGIFAAGVAVGLAGDKVYIKMMFKKHYQDILKDYRLHVGTGTTIKGVKKVIISITDKTTGKTFGTTWLPETAKEIGEAFDTVSISLNEPDSDKYDEITRNIYPKKAYPALLEFTRECAKYCKNVRMSVVDVIGEENIKKSELIAKSLGADFICRSFEKGR